MTRIYTRTGDDGETGLADGSRVSKTALRIEVIGAIDELNVAIGELIAEGPPTMATVDLERFQHRLFDLGAVLALATGQAFTATEVERLEGRIDATDEGLAPLKAFILPGGSRAAALAHRCRTSCRRAEREMIRLADVEAVKPQALAWINRLSDYFFVLARRCNQQAGREDVVWKADVTLGHKEDSGP